MNNVQMEAIYRHGTVYRLNQNGIKDNDSQYFLKLYQFNKVVERKTFLKF